MKRTTKEEVLDFFILFPLQRFDEKYFMEIFDISEHRASMILTKLMNEGMIRYYNGHYKIVKRYDYYVTNLLKEFRRLQPLPKHEVNLKCPKHSFQKKRQKNTEEKIISIQKSKKMTMELLKL